MPKIALLKLLGQLIGNFGPKCHQCSMFLMNVEVNFNVACLLLYRMFKQTYHAIIYRNLKFLKGVLCLDSLELHSTELSPFHKGILFLDSLELSSFSQRYIIS